MKREFLENLGLDPIIIQTIMEDHEALKQQLARQEAEAEAFRNDVIAELVAEAHPSSAMAEAETIRQLTEAVRRGDNVNEALHRLKESDPGAFQGKAVSGPIFSVATVGTVEEFPAVASLRGRS